VLSLNEGARFVRASATNLLARFAPGWYLHLSGQTGRGDSRAETPAQIADYFLRCFAEYFEVVGVPAESAASWLRGKTLLEYGPGDVPGVAILMIAHGAEKVYCVDRFEMLAWSEKNVAAIEALLERLGPEERRRAAECFRDGGDPGTGLAPNRIEYLVRANGLSGLRRRIDVVLSRAVLEHVNDLDATFRDMDEALRNGGTAVHQVDLKSHGLHRDNPLDFLEWPVWMWDLMFSHKGSPNRWRVDRYRGALARTGLRVVRMIPTQRANDRDVAEIRERLARPFRDLADDDLAWLGFWLVCDKPEFAANGDLPA
jgi:SAM-dependent methyltransferase